jgi:hypothetical protein
MPHLADAEREWRVMALSSDRSQGLGFSAADRTEIDIEDLIPAQHQVRDQMLVETHSPYPVTSEPGPPNQARSEATIQGVAYQRIPRVVLDGVVR